MNAALAKILACHLSCMKHALTFGASSVRSYRSIHGESEDSETAVRAVTRRCSLTHDLHGYTTGIRISGLI